MEKLLHRRTEHGFQQTLQREDEGKRPGPDIRSGGNRQQEQQQRHQNHRETARGHRTEREHIKREPSHLIKSAETFKTGPILGDLEKLWKKN